MAISKIQEIEKQMFELNTQLNELRKNNRNNVEVPNYTLTTNEGAITLLELFGEHNKLLVIHNMGQGCRYCTLWADGFNGFVPHLESTMSVVLVSKDTPSVQRSFATSRNWQFKMASHSGGEYIQQQSVLSGENNMPGAVVYQRDGNKIYKLNSSVFGPGDLFCSMWSLLGLAGLSASDWTPQFSYWKQPNTLDDGGKDLDP